MTHKKTFREQATALVSKSPDFVYNIARIGQTLFDHWEVSRATKKGIPLILIYQQGRVASTSLYTSLLEANLALPVYHVHTLSPLKASQRIKKAKNNKKIFRRNIVTGKILGQKIVEMKSSYPPVPWKIITVFRDPISVLLSIHFMNVPRFFSDVLEKNGSLDKHKAVKRFQEIIENIDPSGLAVVNWFDDTFFDELSVDVYQYEFDREKGFTIINDPKYDILLLRFENLKTAFEDGAAKLFSTEKGRIRLLHSHLHKDDKYSETHHYVKSNLMLSPSACDKFYSTKFVQHFYSPELILKLTKKWTGNK